MEINNKEVTCDTEISEILELQKYLPTDPSTDACESCDNYAHGINSKISSLHSISELTKTALLINNSPKYYDTANTIAETYENYCRTFDNCRNQIAAKIVEKEIEELQELWNCIEEKLIDLRKEGIEVDDKEFIKYKNKMNDVESRLSEAIRQYSQFSYNIDDDYKVSLTNSKYFSTKLESKAGIPKSSYVDDIYSDWYNAISQITGKSPEELGINEHDKACYNMALNSVKKHFQNKVDNGESTSLSEIQSYWDNIKSGKVNDFSFPESINMNDNEEEVVKESVKESVKKVEGILENLDPEDNGFNYNITVWARCNGVEMDKNQFNEFVESEKLNKKDYYKESLDKLKYN